MTLREAVMEMQARPELIACGPNDLFVCLNRAAYIIRADRKGNVYPNFNATQLICTTWRVYTQEQLDAAAAAAEGQP